ncbi:unnamed protein product [Leptosia nina]|uniref:Uncharacterized protein n=1 Tax=Leptosia nina TaxID=320188 RepID=A0AAV1J9N8_9NEOP
MNRPNQLGAVSAPTERGYDYGSARALSGNLRKWRWAQGELGSGEAMRPRILKNVVNRGNGEFPRFSGHLVTLAGRVRRARACIDRRPFSTVQYAGAAGTSARVMRCR